MSAPRMNYPQVAFTAIAERDTARADADRYKADASGLRAELDALRGLVRAWAKAERAFYDGAASANYDHLRVALKAAEAALRAAVAPEPPRPQVRRTPGGVVLDPDAD